VASAVAAVAAEGAVPAAVTRPAVGGFQPRPLDSAAMGAVETMEQFFELLNAGDRDSALKLMDEKAEMRVHVLGSVRTMRGVDQVGGWFLRADKGFKMIPGGVRDTGVNYECDLLVLRPGAASQHLDATFRVEAGKITSINLAPR
jgi:hypothetical protein